MLKRKIYPDNRVLCPERMGLVDLEECKESCPFFGKVEIDEYGRRYVICQL